MRFLTVLLFVFLFGSLYSQSLPHLIPFVKDNKWGYCDSTKRVIIPAQYHSAEPFENGLALVWEYNGKVNQKILIDPSGKKIATPYQILNRMEGGDFLLEDGLGNFGWMNQKLQVLVKPKYSGIGDLYGNFIPLMDGLRSGIYNVQTKKWVLPLKTGVGMLEHIFGPYFGMSDGEVGYSGILNAELGKVVLTDLTMAYDLGNNHAMLLMNDGISYALMDQKANILFKTKSRLLYPADENRIGFTVDDKKYGFMDFKGKMVIEAQFDQIFNFKNNRAIVSVNEKFGVIDTSGKWIIQPEYKVLNHWFNDFSEKIQPLNKDDSTYFFDINGKVINTITKIESFTGFEEGMMCAVKELKYYAFVNEKGNFITEYKYSGPSKFKNGLAKVTVTNSNKSLTVYYIDKYGTEYIFKD